MPNTRRGIATVICGNQHETKGIRGEIELEERHDGSTYMFPDSPFVCPECGLVEFDWMAIKEVEDV